MFRSTPGFPVNKKYLKANSTKPEGEIFAANQYILPMNNSIRLDIIHPEKARVEHFLSKVDEDLEPIPFSPHELSGVDDDFIAGFKFKVKGRSAFVIVIFAESYSQANKIEAANLATKPNIKWTINGEILFGVESVDDKVSKEMLSFFAGRE